MGNVNLKSLLGRIEKDAIVKDLKHLFEEFDTDRSGKLEGYEIGSIVDVISKYIINELLEGVDGESSDPDAIPLPERFPDSSKIKKKNYIKRALSLVRSEVMNHLDSNNDGFITKEELFANLPGLIKKIKECVLRNAPNSANEDTM